MCAWLGVKMSLFSPILSFFLFPITFYCAWMAAIVCCYSVGLSILLREDVRLKWFVACLSVSGRHNLNV